MIDLNTKMFPWNRNCVMWSYRSRQITSRVGYFFFWKRQTYIKSTETFWRWKDGCQKYTMPESQIENLEELASINLTLLLTCRAWKQLSQFGDK